VNDMLQTKLLSNVCWYGSSGKHPYDSCIKASVGRSQALEVDSSVEGKVGFTLFMLIL